MKRALDEDLKTGMETPGFNPHYQQTMLRIKDPKISIPFYTKHFGMKLVHWMSFPQWKFTVYFLELFKLPLFSSLPAWGTRAPESS